ncbi:MAG: hypothetical protein K6G38_06365 [Gammaproteobacteria bacterium]|nr:hypothetical protein [Gammaproteobacteria bacterium]
MTWLLIVLSVVIVICVITIAIVLYNFMLLLSELNKRQIYIISDILQSIDLSTPHLDTLSPEPKQVNLEDVLEEEQGDNYFNPHEYDVDAHKDEII